MIRSRIAALLALAVWAMPAATLAAPLPKSSQAALDSTFVKAVDNYDIPQAKKLLSHGANINARDDLGRPVLELESFYGRIELVRFLVDHHADVNANSEYGNALTNAAQRAYIKIVDLLLRSGADPNGGKSRISPLAAVMNNSEEVEAASDVGLHSYSVSYSVTTVSGQPVKLPKPTKAEIAQAEKANAVFERQEAMREQQWGKQQLRLDTENRIAIVNMLIRHGADVNARDKQGHTPLQYAATFGNGELVAILLQRGADPRPRGAQSDPALTCARDRQDWKMARMIEAALRHWKGNGAGQRR